MYVLHDVYDQLNEIFLFCLLNVINQSTTWFFMKVQIDKNYNLFLSRKTASVYDEPFSNQFKFTTVTYEIFFNPLLNFDCDKNDGTRSSYIKISLHNKNVISILQF